MTVNLVRFGVILQSQITCIVFVEYSENRIRNGNHSQIEHNNNNNNVIVTFYRQI